MVVSQFERGGLMTGLKITFDYLTESVQWCWWWSNWRVGIDDCLLSVDFPIEIITVRVMKCHSFSYLPRKILGGIY